MKPQEYLVTTTAEHTSRRMIWDPSRPLPLDHAGHWELDKLPSGFRVHPTKKFSRKYPGEKPGKPTIVARPSGGEQIFRIPYRSSGGEHPLQVSIRLLRPISAPYAPVLNEEENVDKRPYAVFVFYGVKDFLVRYQRTGGNFKGDADRKHVFQCKKSGEGFEISPYKDDIVFECDGQVRKLAMNVPEMLTKDELLKGRFIWDIHWWRVNRIPIPPALPPSEEEENEEKRDQRAYRKILGTVSGVMTAFFLCLLLMPTKKTVKIASAPIKINLRAPKALPPGLVKVEPRVQPVLPKPPPPVVAHNEPKPAPAKKSAAPVSPKPAPAKVAAAKPPTAPTATQQKAKAQAQLAAALNFLSPSQMKAMSTTPSNGSKYNALGAAGSKMGDAKVLGKMTTAELGSEGSINTKNARNINSDVAGGTAGKTLNSVQGRVALNSLYDSKSGNGDLGGTLSAKGITMSGAGTLPESLLEKTMAKYVSKFQYCYEKALLTDASLAGNVMMQWTIGPDGSAADVTVARSQLNNSAMHNCLAREIGKIRFPSPSGGAVLVKYPLAFSSASL